MQKHRLSRQGFTLIELSIVLVIIGLLVGGILVARSMVESAKISAQVKQFQQMDIAVNNFILNYRRLPGDGNKDGFLSQGSHIGVPWNPTCTFECPIVFEELSAMSQLVGGYNRGSGASPFTLGATFPVAKIGVKSSTIVLSQNVRKQLFWGLITNDCLNGSAALCYPLSLSELMAIDKKMDDGIATSGTVVPQISIGAFSCDLGQAQCWEADPANVPSGVTPEDYSFPIGRAAQASWGCFNGSGNYAQYGTGLCSGVQVKSAAFFP